jgi:hypothetical protein
MAYHAAKDNMFSHYSNDGPLYVWRDKNGEKYQFHFETLQFMDAKDHPIDDKTIEYFRTKHPVISKLFAKGEAALIADKEPYRRVEYALDIIHGRWPEAEPAIMQNPNEAVVYSTRIIRGRWPEAEPAIMKDPNVAVVYSNRIIRGRWPEAEPAIMKDPNAAMEYSRLIRGRWPEAEPAIMKDPTAAMNYANEVLRSRWPEAEPVIKTDKRAWESYIMFFPAAAGPKRSR